MWIATPTGFYSAVAHKTDADRLVIRARVLQDAEALARWVRQYRRDNDLLGKRQPISRMVVAYKGSDYPWRVIIQRTEWAAFLAAQVEDITYTNFKNEVTKRQGHPRHDIYSQVWTVLLKLEKLPGAMKDHAKRAVAHPLYGNRRYGDWQQPTTGYVKVGDLVGTAQLELDIDEFPCPGCDGEGKVSCGVCGGTGEKPIDPEQHKFCTKDMCLADWDEPTCVDVGK